MGPTGLVGPIGNAGPDVSNDTVIYHYFKIGRASCRERV